MRLSVLHVSLWLFNWPVGNCLIKDLATMLRNAGYAVDSIKKANEFYKFNCCSLCDLLVYFFFFMKHTG